MLTLVGSYRQFQSFASLDSAISQFLPNSEPVCGHSKLLLLLQCLCASFERSGLGTFLCAVNCIAKCRQKELGSEGNPPMCVGRMYVSSGSLFLSISSPIIFKWVVAQIQYLGGCVRRHELPCPPKLTQQIFRCFFLGPSVPHTILQTSGPP